MIERKNITQSDNLRFADFKKARAALRFFEGIENGTAVIKVPDSDGVMTTKMEDMGFYKSLAGDVYVARIILRDGLDTATIDVALPGVDEPVRLSKIKVRNGEEGEARVAGEQAGDDSDRQNPTIP
jgi:hypothetical protein